MQEFSARWGESATSTVELDDKMNISVYPVPFDTNLQIETTTSAQMKVTVYNAVGQLIDTQLLEGANINLNTTDWKAGIYVLDFLNLQTGIRNSVKVLRN